jgi:cytochrome c nitrite reductase small subunit
MQSHHDAWLKSSHRAVATCNDCHAPHGSLPGKLWVKGRNGFHHSLAFTTGRFHEPIRISPFNRGVTEAACRHCHQDTVAAIDHGAGGEELSCIRCHSGVGHP